jgi:hypothetical protein
MVIMAASRASMVEAQGQVAKRIDRYWLRPLLALRSLQAGRLHEESASLHCQLPYLSKNQIRSEAKGPLVTRLLPICFIGRTLKE